MNTDVRSTLLWAVWGSRRACGLLRGAYSFSCTYTSDTILRGFELFLALHFRPTLSSHLSFYHYIDFNMNRSVRMLNCVIVFCSIFDLLGREKTSGFFLHFPNKLVIFYFLVYVFILELVPAAIFRLVDPPDIPWGGFAIT